MCGAVKLRTHWSQHVQYHASVITLRSVYAKLVTDHTMLLPRVVAAVYTNNCLIINTNSCVQESCCVQMLMQLVQLL
jgi:hypothetical protein